MINYILILIEKHLPGMSFSMKLFFVDYALVWSQFLNKK